MVSGYEIRAVAKASLEEEEECAMSDGREERKEQEERRKWERRSRNGARGRYVTPLIGREIGSRSGGIRGAD